MRRLDGIIERCLTQGKDDCAQRCGCAVGDAGAVCPGPDTRSSRKAASTHEHQHLRSRLCRRRVARLPCARRPPGHRRRHRPAKLELIADGKTPVVEEGMVDLMAAVAASGRVDVTTDVARRGAVAREVSLVCVGTPSAPNGSQDQSAMLALAGELGRALRGQGRAARRRVSLHARARHRRGRRCARSSSANRARRDGAGFHLCFQPEFLREGTSIRDYDKPPFTIVGANHAYPVDRLRELFGHLPCEFHTHIGALRGDGQVLLQQLPRAEDHVRQRDGAPLRSAGRRPVRGDGPACARTRSSTSRRRI